MDNYEINGFGPDEMETTPAQGTVPTADSDELLQEAQPVWQEAEAVLIEEPTYVPPQMSVKKKTGRAKKVLKTVLASVLSVALVAALVVGGCYYTALQVNQNWQVQNDLLLRQIGVLNNKVADLQEQLKDNSFTGNGNSVSGSPNVGIDGGLTEAQIYAQCHKSVVSVRTDKGSGSGFILSEDGYVVTNHHVIENATTYIVTMYDGQDYTAQLVGSYSDNDLAVLKVEGENFPAAKIGNSTDLIVGDHVVAIGNALGKLGNTLTAGVVSGKDRMVNTEGNIMNMLQTDTAINPGNSGGPLFNMKGEVVGITTAKYFRISGTTTTAEGISFAIPIDDVKNMIVDLVTKGRVTGPFMGIEVTNAYDGYGVYVKTVFEGSAAEAAGMQPQDIIVAIGGYEVTSISQMSQVLRSFRPGETTTIIVYRDRQLVELSICFDETPIEENTGNTLPDNGSAEDWYDYFFGQNG